MENDPPTFEEKKEYASKYHQEQHKKLSSAFAKKLNKKSFKNNLITYSIAGFVFGNVFGFVLGHTKAQVPVRNQQGHVVEYKFDMHKMTKSMYTTLAAVMLLSLLMMGVNNIKDKWCNSDWGDILADDAFKGSFGAALKEFEVDPNKRSRAMDARVLIMYNMPTSDLNTLQNLALSGLKYDSKTGYYKIEQSAIDKAANIISTFINSYPEVGYNVIRIMRGDKPLDYRLDSVKKRQR